MIASLSQLSESKISDQLSSSEEEDVGGLPCSPAGQISCPTSSWQWRSGPLWFLGTAAVECGGVYHWENVQS